MECVKIRRLIFLLCVVVISTKLPESSAENSPTPDISAYSDDDNEQELSSQLQDADNRNGGWSDWSDWSSCSRSCDGGISHQIRTCHQASCRGEHIRRRICNMQSCPERQDFREQQCFSFNEKPYKGIRYAWSSHYDEDEPCALFCKGKSAQKNDVATDEPVLIIARMNDKVHDGTRCRAGSLDMCIDGKCENVGCDLRIGSRKQVDACGVCGGDGSSCARPLYHWTLTPMSLCSVTCGGGYKMSRSVCHNRITGEEAEEQLCNESDKPDSTVIPCNSHNCPPRWHTGEWGPCTVNCGMGSRTRQVYCVEEANNTKIMVDEMKCFGLKPRFQEPCNQFECPAWHSSTWSGCSVSCGEGVQIRLVECRDHREKPSTECDPLLKPTDTKPCSTGIQCPFSSESNEEYSVLPYHQPLIQPYPPLSVPEKLVGDPIVPSETTFVPDQWGPCSVSCGEGVRKREVHCKIFLEFSRTIAKLPDHKCGTPKPIEIEKCYMGPCTSEQIGISVDTIKDDPFRSDIKVAPGTPGKTYSWKEQGYTHCSATCLGGMQELIVNCIRDDTGKVTSPYLCPMETKPEILKRICNDHPCPPKWNYSEFSPCTQSCGIGLQTREVNCIHEVTQGGRNTIIVPNNNCPQPPPPDRQFCNILDCPVRWVTTEWSRCSKSCDGGEKTRRVECKQTMAQNHTVSRTPNMCPSPKPPEKKPCNTKSCVVESDKPKIFASNNTFIQHNVKQKKISLTIGGAATVFLGTTIKIKCPVKRFDKTKISWLKDKIALPKSKKFKTSKKGALRIQNLSMRESGSYTCIAGKSSASIQISVRPKPGEFPTSEEIQKPGYKHPGELNPDANNNRDDMVFNTDDQSHEQRPDSHKRKSNKPKLFTPTLPSLTLENNQPDAWQPESTNSQDIENNDQDNPLSSSSESLKPAGSSASRPMPQFQSLLYNLQLLWPFQVFNSRGHRMISSADEYLPQDVANADQLFNTMPSEGDDVGAVILGRGAEDLKFEWWLGTWSGCSEPCGFNGIQTREKKCIVKLHNNTQEVNMHLCIDAHLSHPETVRGCNREECPRWRVEPWSDCRRSKCFSLHKGLQRRTVRCYSHNGTLLRPSKCDKTQKPVQQQECYNDKCVGKWRAGAWSECAAGCEMHGVKYRILQCVWFGTKKPAGTACKDSPRPPVMKPCVGPPCSNSVADCKDHSMFCPNVKTMSMCKVSWYTQQCCESCKN